MKIMWRILYLICIILWFIFLIKNNIYTATHFLVMALISDAKSEIISLKEKSDID